MSPRHWLANAYPVVTSRRMSESSHALIAVTVSFVMTRPSRASHRNAVPDGKMMPDPEPPALRVSDVVA